MNIQTVTPFQLPAPMPLRWLANAAEHLLGLSVLDNYYRQRQQDMNSREFLRYSLEILGVNYQIASGSVDSIPDQGPVIVVANHPFGGIEGMVLAELLLQRRSDVQILANHFLNRIDEMAELFIGVDVFDKSAATRSNIQGVKKAFSHLKNNGVLLVFPAGEVSSVDLKQKQVTDREWNRIIGLMIRKTSATTVPVFIEGSNSKLFHMMGMLHPRFRTMLLVRELLNKRNQSLSLHLGEAIASGELKSLASDEAVTSYLRLNTYLLASRADRSRAMVNQDYQSPIAPPVVESALQVNIQSLSESRHMVSKDDFEVYCAPAHELPYILPEIGRLREITFRQVGEGTGKACDLDEYDEHYLHLFIWHKARCEIVGAYRLGLVDKLMAQQGVKGLYSRSLFSYRKRFIKSLGPAIEMGRSFIRSEYQRSLSALLLLWKGIATYAARNPQYTTLFGPVSISSDYSDLSRSLMSCFLELHHYDQDRAVSVKPTNPQKKPRKAFWTRQMLADMGDSQLISKLVYRMEGDKGLPVLIRQYLSLNGSLVSFNVDKSFNNALDGMIIVDLLQVPEKVLAKYMGKDQACEYLSRGCAERLDAA